MFRDNNDKEYVALVAENRLITDVQLEIERTLDSLNMTQAELARAANLSEARISQILSGNGKNLQARTIARIAFVLGKNAMIQFSDERVACESKAPEKRTSERFDFQAWAKVTALTPEYHDVSVTNDNELHLAGAA